jgi:hypothetical protein
VGFDLVIRARVPFLGHPVSTGAACPCHFPSRVADLAGPTSRKRVVRGWAVPAETAGLHQIWVSISSVRRHRATWPKHRRDPSLTIGENS